MNNVEIDAILKRHCRGKFLGTFSPDQLPARLPRRREFGLIVNSETDPAIVGHWVALFARGTDAFMFDSYGRSPRFIPLLNRWCRRHFAHVYYSKRREQSPTSNVCGAFAIFVIWHMCKGVSFRQIVARFRRIKRDDAFAANWLRRSVGFAI
jgi:hypothetical protein